MKQSKKQNVLKVLLAGIFAATFAVGIFAVNNGGAKSAHAYTSTDVIDNIYLGGGKFDRGNLDKLAAKAGYTSGVDDLVTAASAFTATTEKPGFKTSEDFGDTVVNFGTYTYGGVERELSWLPTFISKSDGGDVILTLWLAGTDSANGSLSNQEVSTFSDATYSNGTKKFNDIDVYSNTYDGSYIRNYILNGDDTYAGGFGNGTAINNKPEANTLTKFTQFTTGGELANYIVAPKNVGWQNAASYLKNDANWNASGYTQTAAGVDETYTILGAAANYPKGWLEDKIWLPSLYETFDNTISSDGTRRWDFNENGGLWKTGDGEANRKKRSNLRLTWLRSGTTDTGYLVYILDGAGDYYYTSVDDTRGAVRPALHLNLTKAAANSFNTIDNIYDQTNGKFSGANLNELANAANFADFKSMVQSAKDGEIKTSADFGDTVVKFGSYTFGGIRRDLTWIPAYVSEDDTGNAILTLWLAGTDSKNGTVSNQEVSTFTGSGHNTSGLSNPSSNNYDTSKIRTEMLNNKGKYYSGYNGSGAQNTDTGLVETDYTPTDDNKFSLFTTGALKDYIVTPNSVSWQNSSDRMKNDPNWVVIDGFYNEKGWLGDKLWLPSVYEVLDNTIVSNSTSYSFTENGGLWKTGDGEANRQKRSNAEWTWLRSGSPTSFSHAFYLNASGVYNTYGVGNTGAVRPALHLNLNMAATSACGNNSHISGDEWFSDDTNHWKICTVCGEKLDNATHGWDKVEITKEATCAEEGVKTYTCTTCGATKTEPITKIEHAWGTEWLSDTTDHWHECNNCDAESEHVAHTPEAIPAKEATCTETGLTEGSKCSVCQKILTAQDEVPLKAHTWNEGTVTKQPTCKEEGVKTFTCTQCPVTKTEAVEKLAHTPEAIPAKEATCTETGLTEGSKCSVCNTIITAQKEVPAKGHTPSPWKHDENEHWKLCSTCNEKLDTAGHKWSDWTITKEPTTEETGEKRCSCSVCGQLRVEKLAKLVNDEGGNGSVSDLPDLDDPNKQYELEITVEATNKVYALDGISKGYNVQLWIVGGETKVEYDKSKELTLSLIVPAGMEEFTLYKLVTGGYEPIDESEYTVENGVLSIRTTLPEEFIFNEPAAATGLAWWVWLVIVLGVVLVAVIIVIIVLKTRKKPETVVVQGSEYDDAALKAQLAEQNKRLEDLENRDDGGFNDPYDGEL